jgi:signal transduction histidine kinase
MARRTLFITYLGTYLLAISNIIRTIILFWDEDNIILVAVLHGCYLVLLISERVFIRRNRLITYIYFVVQIAIIAKIASVIHVDHWAGLIIPLVVQVMHNVPNRIGFSITGILSVIMSYLMISELGPAVGLPLVLSNLSGYFLLAAAVAIIQEAVAARDESRKQKAELQVAHQQLLAYTKQAEELAVLEERNRLARELHDAVTQTLFSASLIAEALPALWERDQEMGRERLAMLRQMSRGALAEMRTLLLELRPAALVETGLEDLLRQLSEAVTGREGVPVTVEVDGLCELPADLHVALYRIAQEALNNVVKHAKASQVAVSLRCTPRVPSPSSREGEGAGVEVELCIRDDGRGFDPDEAPSEHMGLGIMRERAEAVGAQLGIVSQTGRGTQVTMVWPGDEGQQNNRSSSVC